jgi:hypothetical protein
MVKRGQTVSDAEAFISEFLGRVPSPSGETSIAELERTIAM